MIIGGFIKDECDSWHALRTVKLIHVSPLFNGTTLNGPVGHSIVADMDDEDIIHVKRFYGETSEVDAHRYIERMLSFGQSLT